MNLTQAVNILNQYYHRGHNGWMLTGGMVQGTSASETLTPFEAIATATAYVHPVVMCLPWPLSN
jgi:hypothetical protein